MILKKITCNNGGELCYNVGNMIQPMSSVVGGMSHQQRVSRLE